MAFTSEQLVGRWEDQRDLKNLMGFRFQQHPTIRLPQERLDALSQIVNQQIEAILN